MDDKKAVIYDMDGLLIDSEPLWRQAEIGVFREVGIELSEQQCLETTGLRVDEVVAHWFSAYSVGRTRAAAVEHAIWERVIRLVREKGTALPGAVASITYLHARGMPLALASTSNLALIDTVLDALAIRTYFSVVHSAEFEERGKPHPGVYLTTAAKLGVEPTEWVACEDSLNGVIAAKAARMYCVAVPSPEQRRDPRFALADTKLGSLAELDGLFEAA